jgi:hypothetical protein
MVRRGILASLLLQFTGGTNPLWEQAWKATSPTGTLNLHSFFRIVQYSFTLFLPFFPFVKSFVQTRIKKVARSEFPSDGVARLRLARSHFLA